MPELPEVESVRRSLLRSGLAGRTITRADIGWANSVKHPSAEELASSVAGRTVEDVGRRAKYLLFPLTGPSTGSGHTTGSGPSTSSGWAGDTLVAHLGMTGNLVVQPGEHPPHPMTRHSFALDDGRELRFVDGRKFGKLWFTGNLASILPPLGPEPLGDEFTTEWLAGSFAKRNAPVKALLLEQSIAAGWGTSTPTRRCSCRASGLTGRRRSCRRMRWRGCGRGSSTASTPGLRCTTGRGTCGGRNRRSRWGLGAIRGTPRRPARTAGAEWRRCGFGGGGRGTVRRARFRILRTHTVGIS